MFKSTDEGKTWTEIKIPPFAGRVSVAVAMHTKGQRMYIVGNAIEQGSGLYRSDDGGATWQHMAGNDLRIAMRISNGQGNYSSGVFVDSQNPDIVYTMSTAMYRSTDGGLTFEPFKGAPGGEDYHKLWIDPTNGHRMLVGADQGASVTLDNGRTWSLWYTEVISQIYHVATDSAYPYHIMGAQQDTGAVMISSRGNWGQVNFTDWSPVPSSEFGIVRPDPKNPNIIYGVGYGPGGGGSGLIKIDMTTGQWENVAPNFGADADKYHAGRDFEKKFDLAFDPSALYVAYQCLLVSRDGAHSFTAASPDLTTPKGKPQVACGTAPPEPPPPPQPPQPNPTPPGAGAQPEAQAPGAGAADRPQPSISDFSISRVKRGVIWTVSSNGQIYNTMDHGKTWTNVTNIANVPPHTIFNTIEAGDDVNTAFVAARIGAERGQTLPPDENADVPLIWRTTDAGKTWTSIVNGLPRDERTGSWINSLRVDPEQPGLLFAGSETTVYVSFDNGDHWQSLRQNLPSTSIRGLEVHTDHHENDLVICHLRPRLLGSRRHHATAPDRGQRPSHQRIVRLSLQARGGHSRTHQQQLGSALLHRSAPCAQCALRRDRGLLPQPRAERAHPTPGLRFEGQSGPHHVQHPAAAHRGRGVSPLLAGRSRDSRPLDACWSQPRQLEPAV